MEHLNLPPLPLASWQETRDTLHSYSRILGKIRQALTPPRQHWWHISLYPDERQLTTGAIPIPDSINGKFDSCNLGIDLNAHAVCVNNHTSDQRIPLAGQSTHSLTEALLHALARWNVRPAIDRDLFADRTPLVYDPEKARRYSQVLDGLAVIWTKFRGELPGKTSPVQLWPHHFDLSLVWFTGRKVPGVDPNDLENADEQMAFGFSTGDEGTPDAYIYVTAYPFPDGLDSVALPAPARWQTSGWQGALIPYNELVEMDEPASRLLGILRAVQRAGAERMQAESRQSSDAETSPTFSYPAQEI